MEYKHIDDCWNAIREAKTLEEVVKLFGEFPRWSGDWNIQLEHNSFYEKVYVVYNDYYDKNLGAQTDCETLDIEVIEEEE